MKIVFDKVGQTAKPFDVTYRNVNMKGQLSKSGYHRVALEAKMDGILDLTCDRCGILYQHGMNNNLKLSLSDEILKDKEDLDIIEFLDGIIDISYILESEINGIESSYHYCEKCSDSDEDFEIEF